MQKIDSGIYSFDLIWNVLFLLKEEKTETKTDDAGMDVDIIEVKKIFKKK